MVRRRRSLSHLDEKGKEGGCPFLPQSSPSHLWEKRGGEVLLALTYLGGTPAAAFYTTFFKCEGPFFPKLGPFFMAKKQNGIMEAAVPLHSGYFQRRGKCPFLADTVIVEKPWGRTFIHRVPKIWALLCCPRQGKRGDWGEEK